MRCAYIILHLDHISFEEKNTEVSYFAWGVWGFLCEFQAVITIAMLMSQHTLTCNGLCHCVHAVNVCCNSRAYITPHIVHPLHLWSLL